MTTSYRTPEDLVVTFPAGGLAAERATGGGRVTINNDTMAVLAACRDGATAAQATEALAAAGYDTSAREAAAALETLAGAGLLCRSAADGTFPAAADAARITADPTWGGRWGTAAWLFHFATRDAGGASREDLAALRAEDLTAPVFKRYPDAPRASLPPPAPLPPVSFGDVLAGRRTIREFAGRPVSAQQLSQLLYHAHAPHHLVHAEPFGLLPRRAWANGGARSELEAYVTVRGAAGLDDGLYHYQPAGHYLELLGPAATPAQLLDLTYQQEMCAAAPVTVFITAVPGRCSIKYRHARALRVIYSDVGCLAQVFAMAAHAAGLGAYITAAFADADAERMLAADGVRETMLLILGAGIPASGPPPEITVPASPPGSLPAALFDDVR